MNTATLSAPMDHSRVSLPAAPAVPFTQNGHSNRIEPTGESVFPEPKKSRQPILKRALLVALLAVAGLGVAKFGYDWWTVGRFMQSTDDAYIGGDVTVIAPKVSGFIAQLAVTDNQAVHAGDVLIKLDDRDYRAALAKAEAAVAMQRATLANADATGRLQDAIIA